MNSLHQAGNTFLLGLDEVNVLPHFSNSYRQVERYCATLSGSSCGKDPGGVQGEPWFLCIRRALSGVVFSSSYLWPDGCGTRGSVFYLAKIL